MSLSAARRSSIDELDLKAAYGRFATGVAFVEAEVESTREGLIVSSFAAVSLEPPLISPSTPRATTGSSSGGCTPCASPRSDPLVYFTSTFHSLEQK
jgi:hypothetical protein